MTPDHRISIERITYAGWPNCYRLSNGEVELIVTSDVGPRVIRYGFPGGQNLFKEFTEQLGKSGEKEWQARGGHRLWVAPEQVPESYALDNGPVGVELKPDSIEATGAVEPETGLQKQMIVKLAPSGSGVEVVHRITNKAATPRDLAPWAPTMLAQGGTGIHGFPARGKHMEILMPTNPLVMWAFTDFSDPRWSLSRKYLMLRQDPAATTPQKAGSFHPHTFGAYLLGTDLFLKQYSADSSKQFSDAGSSFEIFTNADFLELETVGPLQTLHQGEMVEHVERWTLHRDIQFPSWSDDGIDRVILPLLK